MVDTFIPTHQQSVKSYCHMNFVKYTSFHPYSTSNPIHNNNKIRSTSCSFAFHVRTLPNFLHTDPSLFNTVITVLNSILISRLKFQLLIYSVSSLTTSSKSVISLRPLTCHIPVIPGLIAIRAL